MNFRSPSLKQWAHRLLYLLVGIGMIYTVWNGLSRISESRISLAGFQWAWLPVASGLYFANMLICSFYWHLVLIGLGQRPRHRDSFRAFIMGQLGKYFPGKALVVLLRTSLVSGNHVQPAVAATSVFLETLTYMAVGAGVASLLMIFFVDVGFWMIALGVGAIFAAGLPIAPPVFRFIIHSLRINRLSPKIGDAVSKLDLSLTVRGWLILPLAWILAGLSLWATIRLIGVAAVPWTEVPRLTACAGLAIVAGFLSMMPGGLGVREFVLIGILMPIDPAFDTTVTLVVAVVFRLVWLMTEVILTIILKGWGWASPGFYFQEPPRLDDDKNISPSAEHSR